MNSLWKKNRRCDKNYVQESRSSSGYFQVYCKTLNVSRMLSWMLALWQLVKKLSKEFRFSSICPFLLSSFFVSVRLNLRRRANYHLNWKCNIQMKALNNFCAYVSRQFQSVNSLHFVCIHRRLKLFSVIQIQRFYEFEAKPISYKVRTSLKSECRFSGFSCSLDFYRHINNVKIFSS